MITPRQAARSRRALRAAHGRRSVRLWPSALLAAAVALSLAASGCATLPVSSYELEASSAPGRMPGRPNVLLIVADDQAWSTFDRTLMPSLYAEVVDQGMLFDRAYDETSE